MDTEERHKSELGWWVRSVQGTYAAEGAWCLTLVACMRYGALRVYWGGIVACAIRRCESRATLHRLVLNKPNRNCPQDWELFAFAVTKFRVRLQTVEGCSFMFQILWSDLSSLSPLFFCDSRYDLTQLYMGSEGTLGVICEVVVRVNPIPK